MADEVLPSGGDRGEGTPAAGRSPGEHDGDTDMGTAGGRTAEMAGNGDLAEGTQIAGYRLAGQIGAGGHGAVFRAAEPSRSRWVALKVVSPGLSADPGFRQRLYADASAAAAAGHPHIAGMIEAGEAGGVLYVAMPLAGGGDLGTLVRRRGRQAAARVAVLVRQIAAALDTAHGLGLVHGDVRPANVLLGRPGPDDHAYLSDFGFRYATAAAGAGAGTLDYLAPEQIEGMPAGPRSDQYALACVAYELLGGEPAFRRGDDLRLLRGQYAETPLPLTSLRPDLPPEADLVLARAMAREPDERYPRCLDFAAALTSACGLGRDAPAVPLPPEPGTPAALVPDLAAVPQMVAAPVPLTEPVPLPADPIPPPWRADDRGIAGGPASRRGRRGRRSPVLAVAVLVVLLAIAGGIVMILRSSGPGGGQARLPGAAPHPASSPAGQPPGTPAPSPSPSRHARALGPAGVVRAYFTAINQHRYHRAWRLGGHVSSATYEEFAQGLGTTDRDTVIVLSVNQETVTARVVAVQTDGSVKTYQGTYVVDGGVITQASVSQIS